MEFEQKQELYWGMEEKQFLIMMHLSQFAGFVVPIAGFVLPLAMWLTNKDKNSIIDTHGKNIINWIISAFIYSIIAGVLTIVIIGFPLLILIGALAIIFPIVGAVNVSNEKYWAYPLTIKIIQ